jgi:dihydrofolate reductase
MGRLIVSTAMTVDAVMSVEEWFVGEGGHDEHARAQLARAGAIVLGRKNYEGLAGFWSKETGAWADLINPLPKHVASRTLEPPLTWNATLIEGELAPAVRRLKEEVEGDLLTYGCGELTRNLLAEGLVDVLQFGLHPALWGSGQRPFDETDRFRLRLIEAEAFDSGVVLLRYAPA